jgi:hypothetical protein
MRTVRSLVARYPSLQARAAWLALGVLAVVAGIVATRPATAQEVAATAELQSAEQLGELVGPIALYPDDRVGIVLPASTYPLQIVQAARFLDERAADSTLKASDNWDSSVVALLNYPEVVRLLNDDLDWTWELGAAVLNQRADVLDAIQTFRDRAYTAGNLRSDDRQVVSNTGGAIAIAPADPEVIYVPYYEPRRVVVYQSAPVFHYYPWGYPVYYYPYPAGYAFRSGFFWGVTSVFAVGWHTHHLHVYDYGYRGHPYYGRNYYAPFYARNQININVNVNRGSNVWEPRHRNPARPFTRTREGYSVDARRPANVSRGTVAPTSRYRTDAANNGAGTINRQRAPAASVNPRLQGQAGAARPGSARPTRNVAPNTAPGNYRTRPQPGQSDARIVGRGTVPGSEQRARVYTDRQSQTAPTIRPSAPTARPSTPPARTQAEPQRSTGQPRTFAGIAGSANVAPPRAAQAAPQNRNPNAAPRYRNANPVQAAPPSRSTSPGQAAPPSRSTSPGQAAPRMRTDGGGGVSRPAPSRGGEQRAQPQRRGSNEPRSGSRSR